MKKFYYIRLTIAGIILLLSILAVCGIFYPVKFLDVQFTPLLGRVICDFSLAALVLFLIVIAVTFLFGRIYCSTICPFGILQEFAAILFRKKENSLHKSYGFKYIIAALTFGLLIGGSAIAVRYIDPYTIFGSAVSCSVFGITAALTVLAIVFFKNRFFCTNICPAGAVLGLISKFSLFKIYLDKDMCISCGLCAQNCPSCCINKDEKLVDNETCIKCLKCLGACKKGGVHYGIPPKVPVKFNIGRRNFIWTTAAFVMLGGALKAGVEIADNTMKKFRDIILPPGAVSENRMFNKCLNCNLCVENCPNKILTKSDEKFPTVHIDYTKGEKFCKYDCNECSKVCPSGAIKKISLEEKQKTRIGMAAINSEKCSKCGICSFECPAGAITRLSDGSVSLNGQKCIGCGKCKAACPTGAIDVFAVTEQKMI